MRIGISDDYAVAYDDSGFEAYYGYEHEDDGEWCFSFRAGRDSGGRRQIKASDLGLSDMFSVEEGLIRGMAEVLRSKEPTHD